MSVATCHQVIVRCAAHKLMLVFATYQMMWHGLPWLSARAFSVQTTGNAPSEACHGSAGVVHLPLLASITKQQGRTFAAQWARRLGC